MLCIKLNLNGNFNDQLESKITILFGLVVNPLLSLNF